MRSLSHRLCKNRLQIFNTTGLRNAFRPRPSRRLPRGRHRRPTCRLTSSLSSPRLTLSDNAARRAHTDAAAPANPPSADGDMHRQPQRQHRQHQQHLSLSRAECLQLRTANYCEENVWRILTLAAQRGFPRDALFAVFISNATRRVWFRRQLAASPRDPHGSVCWDYHVIAVVRPYTNTARRPVVYDIDSMLPFPCPLPDYIRHTLIEFEPAAQDTQGSSHVASAARPAYQFRVVPFDELVASFSSDRSHMVSAFSAQRGRRLPVYASPPPPHQCIRATGHSDANTLPLFLHVDGASASDQLCAAIDKLPPTLRSPPGTLLKSPRAFAAFFEPGHDGA